MLRTKKYQFIPELTNCNYEILFTNKAVKFTNVLKDDYADNLGLIHGKSIVFKQK